MAFTENALFKDFGVICWSPLPSSLLQLSIDKGDSNGFFSTRRYVWLAIDPTRQLAHH